MNIKFQIVVFTLNLCVVFTHIQVYLISRIYKCICVGFFFSQPQMYIRIILRAVKGDAKVVAIVVACIL